MKRIVVTPSLSDIIDMEIVPATNKAPRTPAGLLNYYEYLPEKTPCP